MKRYRKRQACMNTVSPKIKGKKSSKSTPFMFKFFGNRGYQFLNWWILHISLSPLKRRGWGKWPSYFIPSFSLFFFFSTFFAHEWKRKEEESRGKEDLSLSHCEDEMNEGCCYHSPSSPLLNNGKKLLELQREKLLLLVRMVIIPFVRGTKEKGQKFPPLFLQLR